jgi:scyllo-inositol 2-dehydrogenase (NADP+)
MNNPIQTALLSFGMSGEVFHGPLLGAHEGFQIRRVWHRDKNKPARHHYPVVSDLKDIVLDKDIELVFVNTPNSTHYAYAKELLDAGKHVVVEKPFTVSVKEADDLIRIAAKNKCILTVYQNRRWDGDFLTVKSVIDRKLVGKLVEFESHYDRFRNQVDTNTWKEQADAGTGVLYNLGSHMIDQAYVLFGNPRFIDARMGIQRPGGEADDYYDIRMEYEGFNVILKSSYLVKEQGPRYILHGTEGSFIKYGLDPQEQALKDKADPKTPGFGTEAKAWWGKLNNTINNAGYDGPIETVPGNYLAFYDNLYAVIRQGETLAVKPEEARDVIRLIEACFESKRNRCAVEII